jgi:hypothetical protein
VVSGQDLNDQRRGRLRLGDIRGRGAAQTARGRVRSGTSSMISETQARACNCARSLDQAAKLGGGSHTDELVPGSRFNTQSAAHNIINATGIVEELGLRAVGLEYREMEPFSVAVHRDGAIVRFHRSVEQAIESIHEVAPADADRSLTWISDTMPIMRMLSAGLQPGAGRGRQLRRLPVTAWWHAVGGAQGLIDALPRRLEFYGGQAKAVLTWRRRSGR